MPSRIHWIDNLRGFFIILLIIFHWFYFTPIDINESTYSLLTNFIKFFDPYRIEVLFFISGMIVCKGAKKPFSIYISGKLKHILYPFFIWSLIYYFVDSIALEKKVFSEWLLNMTFGQIGVTWFLYALFIFFLIIRVARKINPILVLLASISLCLTLKVVDLPSFMDAGFVSFADFFYYFAFFYLADQLNLYNIDISEQSKKIWIFLLSIICLLVVSFFNFHLNLYKTNPAYLPFVFMSLPLFIIIFSSFLNKKNSFLNHFGVNSMVYYVTHLVFLLLFLKLNAINNPPTSHPILILFISFLGPYFIIKLNKKIKIINILFEPPKYKG